MKNLNLLTKHFTKSYANREALKSFQKQLYAIRNSFESKLKKAGVDGMNIISSYGLKPENFKFGVQGGVGQYFYKLSLGGKIEAFQTDL